MRSAFSCMVRLSKKWKCNAVSCYLCILLLFLYTSQPWCFNCHCKIVSANHCSIDSYSGRISTLKPTRTVYVILQTKATVSWEHKDLSYYFHAQDGGQEKKRWKWIIDLNSPFRPCSFSTSNYLAWFRHVITVNHSLRLDASKWQRLPS